MAILVLRARYRDFYDLYLIFEQYGFDLEDIMLLIRQKEVRRPITSEALRENWRRAARELEEGKDLVAYSRMIDNGEIDRFVKQLGFEAVLPTK